MERECESPSAEAAEDRREDEDEADGDFCLSLALKDFWVFVYTEF